MTGPINGHLHDYVNLDMTRKIRSVGLGTIVNIVLVVRVVVKATVAAIVVVVVVIARLFIAQVIVLVTGLG